MKKKDHIVGTLPEFSRQIIERGKLDITSKKIYDHPPSWLRTDTSIKSDGVKLVLRVHLPQS